MSLFGRIWVVFVVVLWAAVFTYFLWGRLKSRRKARP